MHSYICRYSVLFLVRSLQIGGAERQLAILATGLREQGVPVTVVAYYEGGALSEELVHAGVSVLSLDKKGRWDVLPFCIRLMRLLRTERPTILHGYLDISNLLALLAKPLSPETRVVWGVRASNADLSHYDWLGRLVSRLEGRLARYADCVIANSWAGKAHAVTRGFPAEKIVVVPNGIDSKKFSFDAVGRQRMRENWGITDGECVIGLCARLHPVKDHPTFLKAARQIVERHSSARFVCVGDGPADFRRGLHELARTLGLDGRLIWAGTQDDMPAVYSAFDVACSSSSSGEGFPNVIGEAMACERICVVTAVGDSARVVGDTGLVVAPGDPAALAAACLRLIFRPIDTRQLLGAAARARIVAEFGVEKLVRRTQEVLGLA